MPQKVLLAYHRFPPIADDLKNAFERQGVKTEIFYTTDYEHWFYYQVIRRINKLARNLRLVRKGTDLFESHPLNLTNHVSSHFEKRLAEFQPDAILVIHGLPFGESVLSTSSIPKIGWHLEPRDDLPYLISNASPFNIYNSFSQKDVDLLVGEGFDCRYLCHAVAPEKFYSEPDTPKKFDLTFVGNWSVLRDETVNAALEVTQNIALYGNYWKKKSIIPRKLFRQIYKGEKIVGPDLNHLFNQSRIVLNASRIPGSYGLNMRFFEVLSAGSILLTDRVPELDKHFSPDTHLVTYQDTNELKHRLCDLLANPQQQDCIRYAGQSLVHKNHRYDLMAQNFLNQFQEIMGEISPSLDGSQIPK
ncbi:MAG: glycosyltransferase [Gallionellaceae bacterium]